MFAIIIITIILLTSVISAGRKSGVSRDPEVGSSVI